MYLFDTNIFLEILLSQEKSMDCKKALIDHSGHVVISDFSLHSIGVILFRYEKAEVFNSFVSDVLPKITVASLSCEGYEELSELKSKYDLDFDDSYQFKVAKDKYLTIITMDKDFRKVEEMVNVQFI